LDNGRKEKVLIMQILVLKIHINIKTHACYNLINQLIHYGNSVICGHIGFKRKPEVTRNLLEITKSSPELLSIFAEGTGE